MKKIIVIIVAFVVVIGAVIGIGMTKKSANASRSVMHQLMVRRNKKGQTLP
nr:hypothetical protein [Leuconostoc lactis]